MVFITMRDREEAKELLRKAYTMDMEGKKEEYISTLQAVIKKDPYYIEPYAMLGFHYYKEHQWELTLYNLKRAVDLDPMLGNNEKMAERLYITLGKVYQNIDNKKQSLLCFKTFVGLFPISEAAERIAKQIYSSLPDKEVWFSNVKNGYHCFLTRNFEEALTTFRKAIVLNRNFSWCNYYEGRALISLNRYREGITAIKRALELDEHFLFYYELHKAYELLNEEEEAQKLIKKTLELNPYYSIVMLQKSEIAIAKKDYEKAERYLVDILYAHPKDDFVIKARSLLKEIYARNQIIDEHVAAPEKPPAPEKLQAPEKADSHKTLLYEYKPVVPPAAITEQPVKDFASRPGEDVFSYIKKEKEDLGKLSRNLSDELSSKVEIEARRIVDLASQQLYLASTQIKQIFRSEDEAFNKKLKNLTEEILSAEKRKIEAEFSNLLKSVREEVSRFISSSTEKLMSLKEEIKELIEKLKEEENEISEAKSRAIQEIESMLLNAKKEVGILTEKTIKEKDTIATAKNIIVESSEPDSARKKADSGIKTETVSKKADRKKTGKSGDGEREDLVMAGIGSASKGSKAAKKKKSKS